jgi:hypothetical protein
VKMTIVIDTDDAAGIRDAFKIATMFYTRYYSRVGPTSTSKSLKFSKIGLIKLVREYAKENEKLANTGQNQKISSLKRAKDFVEVHMATMRSEDGGTLGDVLTNT